MTKIIKSKFYKQLKSYKIPKKNLNLLHKKCFYNTRNHNGTKIFQEQVALNLNNMKTKDKNKMILRKSNVCNTASNVQTREMCASNVSDASYNKNLHNFPSSMDYTTLSCCNSKLVNSDLYTSSSTRKDMLQCQKKHIHHSIKKPSRPRHIANLRNKQKNKFPRNQRGMVQTKSEGTVLDYSQEEKDNAATSYNYLLRRNTMERKQKLELNNLETNNVQLIDQPPNILKPRTTENKVLTIPRKRKKQSLVQCDLELAHDRHDHEEEIQIIIPNFHKENFTYNTPSKKACFSNSIKNGVRTRSMTRSDYKDSQENVNLVSSVIDIPETKATKSICAKEQTLQKPQNNISAFSLKNRQEEDHLNEGNISHVIEVKEETTFQRNLEVTTHFHSKSNTTSCSLRNNNFSNNKILENNENHSLVSIQQQQEKLHYFAREKKQNSSLKHQENKDITQTIFQTNLQHLVDSNLENNCNISMNINKKNQYEINKSIKIGKSKTNVHSSINKKEIIKSECHIQIDKDKQEQYDPLKKCKRNAIEMLKKTYVTKTLKRTTSADSFKITVQTNRNNININGNSINDRKLLIPLIKLEDLSLRELSHQLYTNHYIKNKINNSLENETQYAVKNVSAAECSVHRQYKITKVRGNTKLNRVYKNLQKYKNRNANDLYESKGKSDRVSQKDNTEIKTATFVSTKQFSTRKLRGKEKGREHSRNNISKSNVEEYFTTKAGCEQLSEDQFKLNMSLEEASNSINEILGASNNYADEFLNNEMDAEIKEPKYETNKCKISKNNKSNGTRRSQDDNSEIKTNELIQNIYKFFLNNKEKEINKKELTKAEIRYLTKNKKSRKLVAVCSKCKQVLNLLQQFSNRTNFIKDEKLQIECTLCNVHMNSLSHFQNHLMTVHLLCEGKLLSSQNQFVVDIIDLKSGSGSDLKNKYMKKFVFECCCCLKVFKHQCHFREHVRKVHAHFNFSTNKTENYKKEQVTGTSETDAVNKNLIPDLINNTAEISNEVESNHIEKHCINKNKINVLDNSNSIVNEEEKQNEINETDISMNDISYSDSTKDQSNQKHKKLDIFCKALSYQCNICSKKYKRRHAFISHMSKHATNSNDCMQNVKEIQEISHDNNENKVENNEHLPKICTNNSDDYSDNCENNNASTSIAKENKLEKTICNITTEKSNAEQIENIKNDNIECIKDKVSEKRTAFDYNYLLRVNCTKKLEESAKQQRYIKGNVNISKKLKMENTKQQIVDSETEEAKSYAQEEIRCNICNNKFNSQRMLKEHMFFLHDSILEDQEVSNLLLPYLNDQNIHKNASAQDDDNFENKHDISEGKVSKIITEEESKMYETIICKMFSKCSIDQKNKKWHCDQCKENFALIRNYLRHKYYIHNDTSVVHVCDNCNKVLTSVAMVNIHICTNVDSWNCKRCNLSFDNGIPLMQHNINYHFEIAGPHICNVCTLEFLTVHMLEKHQSIHSLINHDTNVSNVIDTSVCIQNELSDDSDNWEVYDTEYDEGNGHETSNKFIPCMDQNIKDSNNLATVSDTSFNEYTNSNISLESNIEETFKCKFCNIICLTKKQLKFHFEKWHNLNGEICELCNRLYIADELTDHIINFHVILSDFNLRESSIHNLVKLVGLKRLITLYEYQRFDSVPKETYFNCILCLTKFLNVQSYKTHYLRFHDTICLLCNTEFKNHYQAFKHKIKFHVSVDSYLWVIQKITAIILQSDEHESTLEDIILQYSEIRIYDDERCTPDLFPLSNNGFKILDDKEFLDTSGNGANSV